MIKIFIFLAAVTLLGVSCTPAPQSTSAPQPAPASVVQEEQQQDAEEESFDTSDYLDEALKELDAVDN